MRKRNTTITIRCTEEEKEKIYDKAAEHNLTLSGLILRSVLGKKIVVAEGIDEVLRLQKYISNNLNQIATLVHMDRVHAVNMDKLTEQYMKATDLLSKIVKEISVCR